jgi:hypothetical protein
MGPAGIPGWAVACSRVRRKPAFGQNPCQTQSGDWNAMGKQNYTWSTILMMALTAATLVGMVVLVIKFLSAVIHTSV